MLTDVARDACCHLGYSRQDELNMNYMVNETPIIIAKKVVVSPQHICNISNTANFLLQIFRNL